MTAKSLPSGWTWKILSDIAAPIPNAIVDGPFGSNLKVDDYRDSGVPVLQGKNVTNDTFRWFDIRYISDSKAAQLKRSSVRVGDILMVKIGSIGYSAYVDDLPGSEFAIIPANLAKMTPNLKLIDARYLLHWLKSDSSKRYLREVASKTAQPALSLSKIKQLPIPTPTIPEQRRIAAILDQAEALRTKRRQTLAKLDTLTQSLFLDMFGDPESNARMWPKEELKGLGEVSTGGTPPGGVEGMFGGHIPFITPGDLATAEEPKRRLTDKGASACRTVRAGATMVCCIGATIGKMDSARVLSAFNQQINVVSWRDKINDTYGLHVMQFFRSTIARLGASTTLPILKKSSFERLAIPVPPLALQTEFAAKVGAIGTIRVSARGFLRSADEMFASTQHRAFRGEL